MLQSKIILLVIILLMVLALAGIVQAMFLKTNKSHDPKNGHHLAMIYPPAPGGVHHLTNNETSPLYVGKLAFNNLLREGTTDKGSSNAAPSHNNETRSLLSLNGSNKSKEKYYNDSVLNDQPVHTPNNPSLILCGSGLITLKIFQRRLHG